MSRVLVGPWFQVLLSNFEAVRSVVPEAVIAVRATVRLGFSLADTASEGDGPLEAEEVTLHARPKCPQRARSASAFGANDCFRKLAGRPLTS